jgi:hypothetical protein
MGKIIHRENVTKTPLTIDGVHLSCEHGLKVYLVDGTFVRNRLDSDFVSGSKGVFSFIPANEIWIDASIPSEEVHFLIENECVLAESLKEGRGIEKACARAQRAEKEARKLEKPGPKKNWKRFTGDHCEHGLKIFIVDDTHVRDKWNCIFIQGGHKLRYDFVPKGEIWIAASIPEDELPFVLHHECVEIELMKKGLDYDQAHEKAKRAEDKMRRAAR